MFRLQFLKYLANKQFTNYITLLQNGTQLNTFGCKCISTINLAENVKKPGGHSKVVVSEGNETLRGHRNVNDSEYFVRLKNDPDNFGPPQQEEITDDGDIREEKHFTEQPTPSQKLRTKQYADIIKNLIKQRKIKEAIDVVEIKMLKEDRVKPENYIYNLLLGACGRVGYTKKAFMLYNQMKRRGLKVTGGTYTALFNACANSPWPTTDGLTRATHLRNIMIEKGDEPNDTNYNVMIKAFGRCGDLSTAFLLVDEMSSKGFKIKDDTINFLLQACISDKEVGFRHALLVWRKLVEKNISPSVYTYNLMLRCIRDCGLGDVEVMQAVINEIAPNNIELLQNTDRKLLSSNIVGDSDIKDSYDCEEFSSSNEHDQGSSIKKSESDILVVPNEQTKVIDLRPNLMAPVPHLGSLMSLSEINKPEERLLLVGGCTGFLENMKQHKCTPDIKTFTQLLDNIPSTLASEKELLSIMKKFKVEPDIDFYNMLIKKRSMRFDYESAKEVLVSMEEHKFRPNIITYGVLALGCKNKEEALEFISEMESRSYHVNIQILGAMLYQAFFHMNFDYVQELLNICTRKNIQASKKFMANVEGFIKKCKRLQNAKELTKPQELSFRTLRDRYKNWIHEVQVDETDDIHPWQQYREVNDQEVNHYEWKDGKRFKPRRSSQFKVKTSSKQKK